MKTTQEMIEVMQAYLDGQQIEYKFKHAEPRYDIWVNKVTSTWDWDHFDYRVKVEEPTLKAWVGRIERDYYSLMGKLAKEYNENKLEHDKLSMRIDALEHYVHTVGIDPNKIK